MNSTPISISQQGAENLPPPLRQLVQLRRQADSLLHSPALRTELARGSAGPNADQVRVALEQVVKAGRGWKAKLAGGKCAAEDEAQGEYCLAWALGRIGEFDGTMPTALPAKLDEALAHYQRAADLLACIPPPPALDSIPSVTRPQDPKRQGGVLDLPMVPAWAAEMLAEWAKTQTTLAFAGLIDEKGQTVVKEDALADLLDLACKRNVQALFTPVNPLSSSEDVTHAEASTVMGNARLIRDIASLLAYTTSPTAWQRRLAWATHVADVRFVSASMSATRLVDVASSSAQKLQDPKISNSERKQVKQVVERTLRQIAPFERTQGNVLLGLARTMIDAIGALYLGRTAEGFQEERRKREEGREAPAEEDENGNGDEVPENDLVRETRQVLIRAAALFENAYASILRAPQSARRRKLELRLLRRLEATYCDLELLDNDTPEVVELRSQRIERAVFINDRLVALGDGEDDMVESDHEHAAEDEEDEDSDEEEERLARRFGGQRLA
ncbi:proteophosphoglycan ppg4 [Rhodotorula toruloides]|uniref:Proteophosphoglycan ppg4 n=1 Tax=Rhodotorula toruloides TaxID=5286 RepID=A0A511KKH5_RHOTO|nr:proteophosphoglycan ppg4 [Rhodotorula toruloides]